MSAPTSEVEAAQPAVVAEATTQEQIKPEENVAKVEEQIKEETATANVDAQIKQEEASSKNEEPAAAEAATTDVKTESNGNVKLGEAATKPAPLLKTKAQLNKDRSNKKYDASVLAVTDDPEVIRTQVCIVQSEYVRGDALIHSAIVRVLLQ